MRGRRKARKAKAVREEGGFLVHFVPGGYYHLVDGQLLTGVHRRTAGPTIVRSLLPLAEKSVLKPGTWVTLADAEKG
jgi:hypothetical protein|nr:hypothetical protein [Neorhizobium tomejilense]